MLLNRGWLPWPDRRTAPPFDSPDGVLQLTAWVYVAPSGGLNLRSGAATEGWPRLITQVEAASLWRQLGRGGLPFEVRLESGPASYRVDWPIVAMSPSKHLGYAVQWFALAASVLLLALVLTLRRLAGRAGRRSLWRP